MDINEKIKEQLNNNHILLYMKGSPDFPQCGFSGQTVAALKAIGQPFSYVNIFDDEEVRQGLKTYSNWPTFPQLYVDGELGFEGHTQTAYANALYMGFYTPEEEERAGEYLVKLIEENDGKVAAGFLGTKPMLPALSKMGYTQLAYDLFLSEEYPSWGFEIANGASTIWERWNSYTHEEGFGGERNAGMNSFNHYAFGAVCEWMYEYAAGIKAASSAISISIVKPLMK